MNASSINKKFDILRLQVILGDVLTDGDLRQIASSDYGQDFDLHFSALRNVIMEKRSFVPYDWYPGEVLSLSSGFYGLENMPPARREAEGIRTAFCNAVLLVSCAFPDGYYGDLRSILINLLEALESIGSVYRHAAAETLAGILTLASGVEDTDMAVVALGLFSLALKDGNWTNSELVELIERVDWLATKEIKELQVSFGRSNFSEPWLDFSGDTKTARRWRWYVARLPEALRPSHSQEVRNWVNLVASVCA